MKRLFVLGVVVLSAAIAGFSTDTDTETQKHPESISLGKITPVTSTFPTHSPEQGSALLTELGEVHPSLSTSESLNGAKRVCLSILGGDHRSMVVAGARGHFRDGDTRALLSTEQAEQVVAVIESNGYCK